SPAGHVSALSLPLALCCSVSPTLLSRRPMNARSLFIAPRRRTPTWPHTHRNRRNSSVGAPLGHMGGARRGTFSLSATSFCSRKGSMATSTTSATSELSPRRSDSLRYWPWSEREGARERGGGPRRECHAPRWSH